MRNLESRIRGLSGALLLLAGTGALSQGANTLSSDPALTNLVPEEAYAGVGAWPSGGYWVATGYCSEIDALGPGRGKRTEKEWAQEDAKSRVLKRAAVEKVPDYDEGAYDLEAQVSGFRAAAAYKLAGKDGLFLIGLVKKGDVHIEVQFNPKKARSTAFGLFDSGQFSAAASRLGDLTRRGIQDPETMAYARAASWQVNIQAGVRGAPRIEALKGLGQFYLERDNYEPSIHLFYDLYQETEKPDRQLLETLIQLCYKTTRRETGDKLRQELEKRYPKLELVPIKAASIEPEFRPILMGQPILLQTGGARVVEYAGALYFIAVGVTEVRGDTSDEKLRELRVGRVQAQKEAIAFAKGIKVVAEEKRLAQTTHVTEQGKTTVRALDTLNETTRTEVQGTIKSLPEIGSWRAQDGSLFFFAVGKKLPLKP